MNKRDFITVRLAQGEMHIYDSGGVKLHAYQTGDPQAPPSCPTLPSTPPPTLRSTPAREAVRP